jgi:hypothetical protein
LDKTTNGEEKVKTANEFFEFNINPKKVEEINKFWRKIDESYATISKMIKKDSQSFLSNKKAFRHIMSLVYAVHEIAKGAYVWSFAIEDAEERLVILEKIVEEVTRKLNIDLPNVKAEMEQLKATINSPAITTLSKFVQQMTKNIEEYNKKMENNDLAT